MDKYLRVCTHGVYGIFRTACAHATERLARGLCRRAVLASMAYLSGLTEYMGWLSRTGCPFPAFV